MTTDRSSTAWPNSYDGQVSRDTDEDDLYEAMDWLLGRQDRIERKLAKRHLAEGDAVLYDVSSSDYEGQTCSLMQFGHNRDGRRDRPMVVYGVLPDQMGRPLSVQAYAGNTGDPTTVGDQVEKVRGRFGLERVVLEGDRGLLTETQISHLKRHPGVGWVSALRHHQIRRLVESRVRAHLFLGLLAYYVQWHLRLALAPLLFDDEELEAERARRDPVLAAQPSASAKRKKGKRLTEDGLPLQSLETLMAQMGTRARHQCRLPSEPDGPRVQRLTEPTPLQKRAFELIRMFPGKTT